MQAGHLTERITIEELVEGVDEIGQPINEWRHYLDAWADVRYLSGLEAVKADSQVNTTKASMRIRRRPGRNIKASMRVTHDGRQFNITAVLPSTRQAYLDLVCENIQ